MQLRNFFDRPKDLLFRYFAIPSHRHEQISKGYIKKFLPSHPVVIDCGAHDGLDTIDLLKVIGGTIHAFEPVPAVFRRLVQRTQNKPQIKRYQLALSNQNGFTTFHVSGGTSDGSSSLLPPKDHLTDHPSVTFNDAIEVKTMTLDSWAEAENVNRVDLLWLDMQGFEVQMMMASPRLLKTVKVIHTEVLLKELYDGVVLYPQVRAWLESEGFEVKLEAMPEGWNMGNVVFVRK